MVKVAPYLIMIYGTVVYYSHLRSSHQHKPQTFSRVVYVSELDVLPFETESIQMRKYAY